MTRPVRPTPPALPLQADERTTLVAFLDFYRAAFLDRAFGLGPERLGETPLPTSLSLTRLIGHMAYVEYIWFRERFDGEETIHYLADVDWDADPDAEMTLAETWPAETLFARFEEAVADSRVRVQAADSLDQLSVRPNRDGEQWNLRWILVHMIEEYARHTGHADLIREAIDGNTLS